MNSTERESRDVGATPASRAENVGWAKWVRWISILVIVGCLIVMVRVLPVGRAVAALSSHVEQIGFWGPFVYGLGYVAAAVLLVPGSVLTLAAGALFGLWIGTLVVSLAATTAAAIAFLIGRYLARGTVENKARQYPRFGAIDSAIGQGGWRVVGLLRLSPLVPFSIGNYLFGLTAVRFWPYVLISWLAMLPGTFLYVYLGYAGRAGLVAAGGEARQRSVWEWVLLAVGLLATAVVTWYVTRLARRAMARQRPELATAAASEEAAEPAEKGRRSWSTVAAAVVAIAFVVGTGAAWANQDAIAGLFGPPPVKMTETYAEKPRGPAFDHSTYDAMLKRFVREGGWVDYQGLSANPADLRRYIDSVAEASFEKMGRDEKLALLINAYNAFTLQLILEYYPVESIKDIPADKRWEDRRWNVGGHVWSLNDIEHEQIRPHFEEPRIHFALVCAAVGCPPLRDEAYTADRLDSQLEDQTKYVHRHARWFRFKSDEQIVGLTPLYKWYAGDFEQAVGSVLKYAARFAPRLHDSLEAGDVPQIRWLDYDWALNSVQNGDRAG